MAASSSWVLFDQPPFLIALTSASKARDDGFGLGFASFTMHV